jgi:hypothetical protein
MFFLLLLAVNTTLGRIYLFDMEMFTDSDSDVRSSSLMMECPSINYPISPFSRMGIILPDKNSLLIWSGC